MSELTKDDAEYLTEYLRIVEDFCGSGRMGGTRINFGVARKRLKALNKKYTGKVRPSTLRLHFPAEGLALGGYAGYTEHSPDAAKCWMPSDLCERPLERDL